MALRVIFSVLAIAIMGAFGQTPITVRAGDLAPNLVNARVVRTKEPGDREPGNFLGRITVLAFFPNVSANESLVSKWNELVAKFADQPVNFVWIASEEESRLDPWLKKHPVSGRLLLDAKWDTARAYGYEMGGGAIIDTLGKIAGFTFMLPTEQQIRAVLEGHAVAIQGDATDSQMNEILAERIVRLDAEPHRFPPPLAKPDIPPSYEVHIGPSDTQGTASSEGPDHFVQRGFDLRTMIAKVSRRDPSRIVLPASLDDDLTYDFVLIPPHEMDSGAVYRLVQQAIEKHFHVAMKVEVRPMDVYVMSALEGKTPLAKTDEASLGGGSIGWSGLEWAVPHTDQPPTIEMLRKMASSPNPARAGISEISAFNSTVDDFRLALERGLRRPIIDETKMIGTYDFAVHGRARNIDEFLQALHDQAGIVLTPAHRDIEILVVSPLQ